MGTVPTYNRSSTTMQKKNTVVNDATYVYTYIF